MTREEIAAMAMQVRCVSCKQEQYMPAVYLISFGEHPCVWCGHISKPMTEKEYAEELSKPKDE